ncbi:myb-like protein I [Sabethes cyaneus]|uniref:myb-like protein I n=1 Tax=Sabethes cyaneus TaxID=53552 RepID=UPI00237D7755|nr:myb-like protein I [Sabethes cyaneus]
MVKVSSGSASNDFRFSEQYRDCSSLLKKMGLTPFCTKFPEGPPLEELDPAILSCGLPAIMLSDIHPIIAPPVLRYTAVQLQAMRKHSLCSRRPAIADDPKLSRFSIWRSSNALRKSCLKERKTNQQSDETSKNHHQERPANTRENGFAAPRVRRNYEFSNRNNHVIVKSYKSGDEQRRVQDTAAEEEPEWVASGPTSRLDTIELRGFDEDVSMNALPTSSESKTTGDKATEKHISFFDDLQHYEHVHPKRAGGNTSKELDTSGRETDSESVAISSTNSPPPARSTPTKSLPDNNNSYNSGQKTSQAQNNSINVNNFEEFMKFESLFGSDNGSSGQTGSRFSKWFRRGNTSFNQYSNQDGRRLPYGYFPSNDFANTSGSSQYEGHAAQRSSSGASYLPRGYQGAHAFEQNNSMNAAAPNSAFKRLLDMVTHNRLGNNMLAQQQYMLQMLNKNQQSEILRRMLMKNTMDNAIADPGQPKAPPQQSQEQRMPTHRELQFHTQAIMQNALLRKKLQDQQKMLFEQNSQMTVMAAAAAASAEPNAAVQQFVQSVCPNVQRSLSVLGQARVNQPNHQQKFGQSFPNADEQQAHRDLSASLQRMLLSPPQQRSVGYRFGKA